MGQLAFLDSYPGAYIVQSFLHSAVAAAVVEIAFRVWEFRNPALRQRFLLIAVAFPVFSFPLFQVINPERLSLTFRMGALLDSGRWLYLDPWGIAPLVVIGLLLIFLVTTLVFLFQEFLPVVRHTFEKRPSGKTAGRSGADDPDVQRVVGTLPGNRPELFVLEEEEIVLFSTTGKSGAVYVSEGLLRALPPEEVQAAVAHEYAHVLRGRRPVLLVLFLLRAVMFFNPVTLLQFRRIVQEDEKICDDFAAELTGRPAALAEALRRLYLAGGEKRPGTGKTLMEEMEALESYSHRLHIESRVERLEKEVPSAADGGGLATVLTVAAILLTTYFVV
ncbi:MAG: hypothetical protein A2X88_06055 [Deltaproteobacteria bacterium GWC2_65_14]|nr:MAG: hypothetical protein A2X88_06055 [Deltaproteobacteria bacterium GWC2_65_14]